MHSDVCLRALLLLHTTVLTSPVLLCRPILCFLRLCDGDKPVLGKVYAHTQLLLEVVKGLRIPEVNKKPILEACKRRVKMLLNPLHKAAFFLDPEYWARDLNKEGSHDVEPGVVLGLHPAFLPSLVLACQAVSFALVAGACLKFLSHCLQIMEAFYDVVEQFYPSDTNKQSEAAIQMAAFRSRDADQWKRPILDGAARKLPAH